jgi:molybdopterin/thiamine biosynthesis adenylyltransferase
VEELKSNMTLDMISNRHRGNLGGRLTDSRLPAKVSVLVDADTARHPTAQHLTWMLLNLLARQTYEIREIELVLPGGIPAIQRLSPLISTTSDLKESLREGISRINPAVLVSEMTVASHVTVRIGPGALAEADFALATTAYGWSGYVGQVPVDLIGEDEHPVGAYVAASLCAGEIFKFIRGMRAEYGTFAHQLWVDAASLRVSSEAPASRGPLRPTDLRLKSAVVAGIGAVGNGMLHTLYPLTHLRGELTLIDGDRKGIDVTNLNRYVLFGLLHQSALKASTASELFAGSQLIMHPVDEYWRSWYSRKANRPLDLVISAVDKNSARHAIQNAVPRLILGASTNEMRAQVNLYDVVHGGLCLRCRNPVEEAVPDDVVIARLRGLSTKVRLIEAERAGIDTSTLEAFLSDPRGRCGTISGETLQKFAGEDTQEEWSVGFVSLLSGVLLAAEYLKLSLDPSQVALDAQRNTFKFQFWRPDSAEANKIYHTLPEAACFCQTSTSRSAMASLWGR